MDDVNVLNSQGKKKQNLSLCSPTLNSTSEPGKWVFHFIFEGWGPAAKTFTADPWCTGAGQDPHPSPFLSKEKDTAFLRQNSVILVKSTSRKK